MRGERAAGPPGPAQAGNPAWRSADPACYGRGNITVSRPLGAELSTVRSGRGLRKRPAGIRRSGWVIPPWQRATLTGKVAYPPWAAQQSPTRIHSRCRRAIPELSLTAAQT